MRAAGWKCWCGYKSKYFDLYYSHLKDHDDELKQALVLAGQNA